VVIVDNGESVSTLKGDDKLDKEDASFVVPLF
jgi:hypothetical protein